MDPPLEPHGGDYPSSKPEQTTTWGSGDLGEPTASARRRDGRRAQRSSAGRRRAEKEIEERRDAKVAVAPKMVPKRARWQLETMNICANVACSKDQ